MKTLLLHASFGAGHKRAAQAIREALQENGVDSEVRDLLEFMPHLVADFYANSYVFMIHKARWLWKLVYQSMDHGVGPYQPAHSVTQRWQFAQLQKFIAKEGYDAILSTHFTPAALLTDWKQDGRIHTRIFSVVTDHVAHRCWKRTGLDQYFVPSNEVADQLSAAGISRERITVSGIPISSSFSSLPGCAEARDRWNCPLEATVGLVLCSGLTYSQTLKLLEEISSVAGRLHFLVSTGPDPAKERKVKERFKDRSNFFIFGFSPKIPELIAASDFLITKPGGLIVSEALAAGKPQILYSPIPGQEVANAEYAQRNGAATCIQKLTPGILKYVLTETLSDPNRLLQMSEAAKKIGKPNAARIIADYICNAAG